MNNEKMNSIASWIGMNIIIKYKYMFFILITILLIFGFQGMNKIVVDSSNETFFSASEEVMIQNKRFKEIFGNEEFVFVYIEVDNIFQHDVLKHIQEISQDIKKIFHL